MQVADIPIATIDTGERRRQDFGDIAGLARGIERVGLIEPIVVDRNGSGRYRLVAGERRLRAVKLLGWHSIPAQLREHLTEEQLRDVELEENENRLPLTAAERARTFASANRLMENAQKAKEILARSGPEKTGKRGQPAKPDSTRAVAEALGTSRQAVVRAEQQVETAGQFPWMQGNRWRQSDVLRVRERLEEFREPEARGQVVAILGAARMLDPQLTVNLIENLRAKQPVELAELFRLSQSADPRDRSLALTEAACLPPRPDPRLGILTNALEILGAAIKPFPDDPLTPRLIDVRSELRAVREAVKQVSFDARREQQQKGEAVQ